MVDQGNGSWILERLINGCGDHHCSVKLSCIMLVDVQVFFCSLQGHILFPVLPEDEGDI